MNILLKTLVVAVLSQSVLAVAAVIDFEDLALASNSYYDPDITTSFISGDATFEYDASFGPCCWSGFTYSNTVDTTTPGYLNQYSAITGAGYGGSGNYGVAYADGANLSFGSATTVAGAQFTNTTYSYLAMANGDDGNSTPFIKGPFEQGDFFEITAYGLDANNQQISSLSFLLGDGSNIVSDWLWVDLSSLGEVNGLSFSFDSSDSGAYGVNTPTYFAIDNVTTVPVPAGVWLFSSALIGLFGLKKRSRQS